MVEIVFSKHTKLIVLIQLTSFFSKIYCRRENNTLEISCNIIKLDKHVNETSDDVREILAVNRCLKNYQNYDIIKKCENLIDMSMSVTDFTRFVPVTNRFTNITYWNKHCAICNDETEFTYWSRWSKLEGLKDLCELYSLKEQMILMGLGDDNLREIVRDSIKSGMVLISKSKNSTELRCSTKGTWPTNLLQFVAPCLAKEVQKKEEQRLNTCQYFRKDGRICLDTRLIIEGIDFFVDENDKIHMFDGIKNEEFTEVAYTVGRGIDNVLYMCEKNEMNYPIRIWIKIGFSIVSVIFIAFYLFLNFDKEYLKKFPNKIIYSYSIGLLVMYSLLVFIGFLFPLSCIIATLIVFSWFFHFFWTMIISLELCRLTYCTLRKRKVTVGAQPKRYLIYCILGYVLPVALPIIYFFILETDDNQCPTIPGHFGLPCEPAKDSMAEYMIIILTSLFIGIFFFIIPVLFVLQACLLVYAGKCGPTRMRSTANRNHLIILTKMAYIMGAHWMLYMFGVFYGNDPTLSTVSVNLVAELTIDLQGVFVFLAFGFKKSMLDKMLCECKCKKWSTQESINAGTGTTVHFQSSSM